MNDPAEPMRDEFLSEEDLDLKSLDALELGRVWNAWLLAAQATNDLDADLYEHGVFCGHRIRFDNAPPAPESSGSES